MSIWSWCFINTEIRKFDEVKVTKIEFLLIIGLHEVVQEVLELVEVADSRSDELIRKQLDEHLPHKYRVIWEDNGLPHVHNPSRRPLLPRLPSIFGLLPNKLKKLINFSNHQSSTFRAILRHISSLCCLKRPIIGFIANFLVISCLLTLVYGLNFSGEFWHEIASTNSLPQ